MTTAKKTLLTVLVIAPLLIAGLAALAISRVDSQAVGAAFLAKAGANLGLTLEADEYRYGAFSGLEIEGFRARGQLEAGRLDLEAEKLVFTPQFLPLLAGRIVISEAVIVLPDIRLTRRDQTSAESGRRKDPEKAEKRRKKKARRQQQAARQAIAEQAADDSTGGGPNLDLEIRALTIVHADLELVSPRAERPTVRFEGLDFDLTGIDPARGAERPILDATANGTFSAAAVTLPDLAGTDARGRIELADGTLSLLDLEMDHELGPLRARAIEVDLAREPFAYSLDLAGGPLDTGRVLGAAPDSGMGASSLRFTGTGTGPKSAGLSGKGSLDVAGGQLPPMRVLEDLDRLLGSADLVGASHEPTTLGFRITGERIEIAPTRFEAEDIRLDLEGWVENQGELSLDLVVSAPRGRIEIVEISETVLDKLTDAEGRTALAFQIRGTRENPRVQPDIPELTRSERDRLEQELKDALRDKLRELFGKDDDD